MIRAGGRPASSSVLARSGEARISLRFEEATGRSLRETETVVEVWWALERRRLS
jgi:hypothetical protein